MLYQVQCAPQNPHQEIANGIGCSNNLIQSHSNPLHTPFFWRSVSPVYVLLHTPVPNNITVLRRHRRTSRSLLNGSTSPHPSVSHSPANNNKSGLISEQPIVRSIAALVSYPTCPPYLLTRQDALPAQWK